MTKKLITTASALAALALAAMGVFLGAQHLGAAMSRPDTSPGYVMKADIDADLASGSHRAQRGAGEFVASASIETGDVRSAGQTELP